MKISKSSLKEGRRDVLETYLLPASLLQQCRVQREANISLYQWWRKSKMWEVCSTGTTTSTPSLSICPPSSTTPPKRFLPQNRKTCLLAYSTSFPSSFWRRYSSISQVRTLQLRHASTAVCTRLSRILWRFNILWLWRCTEWLTVTSPSRLRTN